MPFTVNANDPGGGQPTPFPTLGPIKEIRALGSSSYHSGQFKLEKRFSQGVFALASYTWSKSIDTMVSNLDRNALAQSVFLDPASNRAVSDWDVPHRFSLSFIGEVPYGSGRRYGTSAPALAQTVLGGWQVTGIFIARSGMPGTVVVSSNPIAGIGNARPNLVGNPELPASQR